MICKKVINEPLLPR